MSNVDTDISKIISIHALRGEGDAAVKLFVHGFPISIHALRGEGDNSRRGSRWCRWGFLSTPSVGRATVAAAIPTTTAGFLSTPSVGRATVYCRRSPKMGAISIHALRGEGDA